MNIKETQKRIWAEISLDSIEKNYNLIKNKLDKTKICCIVKADAYGHGVEAVAKFYEHLGVNNFAVSNIEEALELRNYVIKSEILILGYTDPKCAKLLSEHDITQTVFSLEQAQQLSSKALESGVKINSHLKIDTGMGRIGFRMVNTSQTQCLDDACKVLSLEGLDVKGIYTHLSVADEGDVQREYTINQLNNFNFSIDYLEDKGFKFETKHCLNSAGVCDYSNYKMDMVRAGIVLYGIDPSSKIKNKFNLQPALTLKAVVSQIKDIDKGDSINYGRTFIADKRMTVATIPIGYADGYLRSSSNGAKILVKGKLVPILGRICMDQLVIDVTGIEDLRPGDEVTIFGNSPANTVEELARINNTIPYEIICAIGRRVPRVYTYRGNIVFIQDYLHC